MVIDQITATGMTILEALLVDCGSAKDLHLLLCSPGGDGETALRTVRSMQARCRELTILVPDMAKSAATIVCLGAHHVVMGPGGDLVEIWWRSRPYRYRSAMIFTDDSGGPSMASAKNVVAAVEEAERRMTANPGSYALFASLLADVNMLMLARARSARPCCKSRLARLLTVSTPVAGGLVAVDADDDLLEGFECVDELIDR